MTSSLVIAGSKGSYSIGFKDFTLESLRATDYVIADSIFRGQLEETTCPLMFIHASESGKTLETVMQICQNMAEAGLSKGSRLIAIGGGVIQDLATLAASIYKRGVDWIYVPTTLVAMMDSCVGGKSSINVGGYKNLVGNVYPPVEIIVDTTFAKSLNQSAIIDGLAEGVKIAFARGPKEFSNFLNHAIDVSALNSAQLLELTHITIEAKKWFVEKDEFDKAERRLLNFGHTFGHALESATSFAVSHGIAIAIGMLAAVKLSGVAHISELSQLQRFCKSLLQPISHELGILLDRIDWSVFEVAVWNDKKNTSTEFRLILPSESGTLREISLPKTKESMSSIIAALVATLKEFKN